MTSTPAVLLVSLLAGCADLRIPDRGPVGVGMTAYFEINDRECHSYYGGEDCHDTALRLDKARSRTPAAVVDRVVGEYAWIRGEEPGTAEIDITSASGSTLTTTFEVLDIVEQTLVRCRTGQDCTHPLVFSRGYFGLNPESYGIDGDGRRVPLWGEPEIVVDAGETTATLRNRYGIAVDTGTVPGKVVVYTSTGIEQPLEIVGPDRIARLEGPPDGVVEVGSYLVTVSVRAFAADGREILGGTSHRPVIETDTLQLELKPSSSHGGTFYVKRVGRGHGVATIRWGTAVTTVRLIDPSLPAS